MSVLRILKPIFLLCRRGHQVLRLSLPPKREYVLLIRMTAYQRMLYRLFMEELINHRSVSNPLRAFAICCKIWNHPDVLYNFVRKLNVFFRHVLVFTYNLAYLVSLLVKFVTQKFSLFSRRQRRSRRSRPRMGGRCSRNGRWWRQDWTSPWERITKEKIPVSSGKLF